MTARTISQMQKRFGKIAKRRQHIKSYNKGKTGISQGETLFANRGLSPIWWNILKKTKSDLIACCHP